MYSRICDEKVWPKENPVDGCDSPFFWLRPFVSCEGSKQQDNVVCWKAAHWYDQICCEVKISQCIFFFEGLAGSGVATAPVYIIECSQASLRGTLASLNVLMLNIAVTFVSAFNIYNFLSWNYISIICACVPVLAMICLTLIPESPYHLLRQGNEEKAIDALKESIQLGLCMQN